MGRVGLKWFLDRTVNLSLYTIFLLLESLVKCTVVFIFILYITQSHLCDNSFSGCGDIYFSTEMTMIRFPSWSFNKCCISLCDSGEVLWEYSVELYTLTWYHLKCCCYRPRFLLLSVLWSHLSVPVQDCERLCLRLRKDILIKRFYDFALKYVGDGGQIITLFY